MVAHLGAAYWASSAALSYLVFLAFSTNGCGRDGRFCKDGCAKLQTHLHANLFGQDLALPQLGDAICDHLAEKHGRRPLVVALHGPPGVGKSYFHWLLAQALYNVTDPMHFQECPGAGCPGYHIVFGTDYVLAEREKQAALLKDSLIQQVKKYPESLVVIEEYDKMDCNSRGLFKQLVERGETDDTEFHKTIVVLEANVGWLQTLEMLSNGAGRDKMSMELAERSLKDTLFEKWVEQDCEERVDTTKVLSMINMFVPFFPLERQHLEQVLTVLLTRRGVREADEEHQLAKLTWKDDVPKWLASKADYDGRFTIEGAKEASTIISRHVTRALRLHRQTPADCTRGRALGRHQTLVELRVRSDGSALHAICIGIMSSDGANGTYAT